MHAFHVVDMTCGHCVAAITKAVHTVDAEARVEVDLTQRAVRINSTRADADALAGAIAGVGYQPVSMEAPSAAAGATRHSSCCGSCG